MPLGGRCIPQCSRVLVHTTSHAPACPNYYPPRWQVSHRVRSVSRRGSARPTATCLAGRCRTAVSASCVATACQRTPPPTHSRLAHHRPSHWQAPNGGHCASQRGSAQGHNTWRAFACSGPPPASLAGHTQRSPHLMTRLRASAHHLACARVRRSTRLPHWQVSHGGRCVYDFAACRRTPPRMHSRAPGRPCLAGRSHTAVAASRDTAAC